MPLAIIAFIVCLFSAGVLFGVTTYTRRLRVPCIFALTAFSLACYTAMLMLRPSGLLLPNVMVLVTALFLGSAIGSLITNLPTLVSFCLAAAIADIVSFQIGATAKLSRSFQSGSSNLLQYLCLSSPVHGHLRPIIGIGDLIILTVIYFALQRLGYRGALPFVAPVAGLMLALIVGLFVGGVFAVPFIAAATLAYVWSAKYRSKDV